MMSSWLLCMCLCFTSLYLPDYCTCTFASPVYDIFLITVQVLLLHQSVISSWLLLIIVPVPLLHQSMISSWLLYMYLCFTSLWYLLDYCACDFTSPVWYLHDYCTCTVASPISDIFLIIVHVPLLHQSMISFWLLYMYFCFISLWYISHYCTCTFASPVYDIIMIIVHGRLLHQSMITCW